MKTWSKFLFTAYLVVLTWLVMFKFHIYRTLFQEVHSRSLNLVPFAASSGRGEIILNVLIFVPFGLLLSMVVKKWSFGKKLLLISLSSLTAETLQYIFGIGASDITDLMTNTTGGALGLLIYALFSPFVGTKWLDRLLAGAGTILLPFLVFHFVLFRHMNH
jgi:glycopeptide antibiotics resistance protein